MWLRRGSSSWGYFDQGNKIGDYGSYLSGSEEGLVHGSVLISARNCVWSLLNDPVRSDD